MHVSFIFYSVRPMSAEEKKNEEKPVEGKLLVASCETFVFTNDT